MDLNWNAQSDSINPFLTTTNNSNNANNKRNIQNPLKINTNIPNYYPPSSTTSANTFKPIPLPDDNFLDFNPLNELGNNFSFNIENYFKTGNVVDPNNDLIDNDFLDANLNPTKPEDIEKVLIDLGISENPDSEPNLENSIQRQGSHKRQLSGSEIFGFVNIGDVNTLDPIIFNNKKPLYKDITNFDNINYNSQSPLIPSTPPKKQIETNSNSNSNNNNNDDYFISTGNPKSFKFPLESPPRGTFNPPMNYLQLNSSSPIKPDLQTSTLTSPLHSMAMSMSMSMSSPIKPSSSSNFFQTPNQSPKKTKFLLASQQKFKLDFMQEHDESTILDLDTDNANPNANENDNERTISEMNTPLKLKLNNDDLNNPVFQTPTKSRTNNIFNTNNNEISKLNGSPHRSTIIKQKMIKYSKRQQIRKKPTITTTLEVGTLDKYFDGPDHEGKFICKFFDNELRMCCGKVFSRISNTRAHIQTHLCDRPFVCNECGKAFVRNHDLRRHQKGHAVAENICPCGKTFPRSDALKRHRLRNICSGGISKKEGVTKPTVSTNNTNNNNIQKKLNSIIVTKPSSTTSSTTSAPAPISKPISISNQLQSQLPISSANNIPRTPPSSTMITRPIATNNNNNNAQNNTQFPLTENNNKPIDIFDFDAVADNNFSFNMDDSLVM